MVANNEDGADEIYFDLATSMMMLTEGKKQMIVVAGIYNLLCERMIVRLVVSSSKRNAGCISRRFKRETPCSSLI